MAPEPSSFALIAEAGDSLADFGPYVAAINDAGMVAFRARRTRGGNAIFLGEGGPLRELELPSGDLIGHPDLDQSGRVCFLAQAPGAGPAFWWREHDGGLSRSRSAEEFVAMGPRGPVMNEFGSAVFCARLNSGAECVMRAAEGRLHLVAAAGERLRAFPGLPVVHQRGEVAFGAVLAAGGAAILLSRAGVLTTVADTEGELRELSAFPALNERGQVAFTATRQAGNAGVFLWTEGSLLCLADSSGPFESFRSVLLHRTAGRILCATPRGGQLGIYRGTDAAAQRLLGLGDPFQDSMVADFALNAVSVNAAGQIAVRVRLANGRQLILRAGISAP